jgi:DNA-binding response OmpR family regulator
LLAAALPFRPGLLTLHITRILIESIQPMAARKTTILIVDDDDMLREELAEQLTQTDEYTVLQAGRIAQGVEMALTQKPGVILLDVQLPDGDGRDGCRELRAKGVTAPILMLTGQQGEADQVLGLDSGANDYVTKPFKLAVLLALPARRYG